MLRLKPRQRSLLVDKVPDLVNIIAGAIVIAYALGEPAVSWAVLVGVFVLWTGAIALALFIAEEEK